MGWMNESFGIQPWQGQKIFLFFTEQKPALGPTQPPIL
jgi:hypothetical protein